MKVSTAGRGKFELAPGGGPHDRSAPFLGVQQSFLRALDTAGAVTPQRTAGGRRRYTRRQLVFAARIRELFDQGHTLAAAPRLLAPEDDLATERGLTARLHERLAGQDPQDGRW